MVCNTRGCAKDTDEGEDDKQKPACFSTEAMFVGNIDCEGKRWHEVDELDDIENLAFSEHIEDNCQERCLSAVQGRYSSEVGWLEW